MKIEENKLKKNLKRAGFYTLMLAVGATMYFNTIGICNLIEHHHTYIEKNGKTVYYSLIDGPFGYVEIKIDRGREDIYINELNLFGPSKSYMDIDGILDVDFFTDESVPEKTISKTYDAGKNPELYEKINSDYYDLLERFYPYLKL